MRKTKCLKTCRMLLVLLAFIRAMASNAIAAEPMGANQDTTWSGSFNKELLVAGDHYYPPFEFINEQGQPDGFNVELFKLVAHNLGLKYQLVLMPWDQLRVKAEAGGIDVVLGMMISEERRKAFSFGTPHSVMTHAIFSHKDRRFTSLEQLKGKRICVQNLDLMHDMLLGNSLAGEIITVSSIADALQMVSLRKCDAALLGNFQGAHLIRQLQIQDVVYASASILPQPYAMAVSKGNDQLLAALNTGLLHLKESGEYEKLHNKWFKVYETQDFWSQAAPYLLLASGFFVVLIVFVLVLNWRVRVVTKSLKQNEEKFRLLIQNQNDLVVKVDNQGRFTYVSPSYCNFFGKTEKELLHNNFMPLVHEDDRQATADAMKALSMPPHHVVLEQRALSAHGWRWLSWSDTAILDEKGQISGIIGVGRDITTEKEAQKALKESDERLALLLDQASNIAMQGYDRFGKVIYWNTASELLYGYTKEEAIGASLFDLIIPEELNVTVRERMEQLMNDDKKTHAEELLLKHKSGKRIPVFSNHAVVDVPGKGKELFCIDIDLSTQKENEKLLRQTNERLNAVFENSFSLIVLINHNGQLINFNQNAGLFAKYALGKKAKPGISFLELLPIDQQEAFSESFKKSLLGESVFDERKIVPFDGKTYWYHFHFTPIFNARREVEAVVMIGNDITQQRQSVELQDVLFNITDAVGLTADLAQLFNVIRAELGKLIDTTNMFIAFYDPQTDLLSTLNKTDDVEGIPEWKAKGSLSGLVIESGKSVLLYAADLQQMEKEGKIRRLGKKSLVWLGVPLVSAGETIGVIAVQSFENENAYGKKDIDLMEFVSGQISLVIQRQRDLIRLIEAKKKAEESDLLKTSFLNNLSHEVRTPLNCIMGLSDMIAREEFTDEERQSFSEIINRSGRQLTQIINDIISQSSYESGQEVVYDVPFELANELELLKNRVHLDYADASVAFEMQTHLPANPLHLRGDKYKIFEIIWKLLDNAFKFTTVGSVKLSVSWSDDLLQATVQDTGIGIDPAYHEVIFKPFRKVEESEQIYRGNGLGLSLAQAYLNMLGGTISVASEKGKGTCFKITVPAFAVDSSEEKKPAVPELSFNASVPLVLIAEDEIHNLKLLQSFLNDLDAEFHVVADGLEVLDVIEAHPQTSLILLDLKMPNLNGFDTARRLRQQKCHIPIIAITAYALEGDEKKAIQSGCDAYLAKPFTREELRAAIGRFLDDWNPEFE